MLAAIDEQGNCNNVVHVISDSEAETLTNHPGTAAQDNTVGQQSGTSYTHSAEFYNDLANSSESSEVPFVMVEKTDDKPAYGGDFGEDATVAQKVAHEIRAADASPDKLVISQESHTEPNLEHQQGAPLFRHETFQTDETTSMSSIDDVSTQSSTDQTGSGDVINTPSEPEETQHDDADELLQGPLLSHETGFDIVSGELENGNCLPHEVDSDNGDADELTNGPLLSHETGLSGVTGIDDSDGEDELDAAPLLPHETGSQRHRYSGNTTNSEYFEDEDTSEPSLYRYGDDNNDYPTRTLWSNEAPTFTHQEQGGHDYSTEEVHLLPHERDEVLDDSEHSMDDGPFLLHARPNYGYETDTAREIFGGIGRPGIFRARTSSSSLPHRMPRSDAEDEDLHDPSLERFPTNREQILDRVATIGLLLPEDETIEDSVHSPVMSIMSQACSSVDLAPVKSYTSLASVPEADDSDDDNGDVESLPSPVELNLGRVPRGFAKDPYATPIANNTNPFELKRNDSSQRPSTRTTESSDAESISKNDGAKEIILSKLQEVIATPGKVLNLTTTPKMSNQNDTSACRDFAVPISESGLRQRSAPKTDALENSLPTSAGSSTQDSMSRTTRAITALTPQQIDNKNETFLQGLFRVVLGPVGRFLTACVGNHKRAG
jgi:hypothetical protein